MTRAAIVTGHGFQDHDVVYACHRALEAGFDVEIATADGRPVAGRHGVALDTRARPCIAFDDLDDAGLDLVLLMGGHEAPDRVRQDLGVLEFVRRMDAGGKVVAGLGHGSWIMISAGIMRGRDACAAAGMRDDMIDAGASVVEADVVVGRNLVTCSGSAAFGAFMQTVIAVCELRRGLAAP